VKENISLFFSGLSVFMTVVFISFSTPADRGSGELSEAALAAMGLVGTSTSACVGEEPVSNLRELMERRFNPSMSRISFALHHSDAEERDRLTMISAEADRIVACVEKGKSHQPEITSSKMAAYRRHLVGMQGSALAMSDSAQEGDMRSTQHWFLHLKQSCIGCHKDVRPPLGTALLGDLP
jgi:hypothetical protein